MRCEGCEYENPRTARFCGGCGEALVRRCGACGHPNASEQRFCHQCGEALSAEEVDAPGAPGPQASRDPRAYTPRHLAERILRSRSALEGERKPVTVLFADVKGSMELAGQVDPEEWHAILETFFEILTEGVHRFEGTINQYTGDGVMALFGAPIAHEDHALRAGYAALHLLERLRGYAREVRREYGLDFATRIGLNSGEVVVGKIGDDLRMDYTAQGHTVGLAQRVESLAESDACFLTQATAERLDGFFELEDLGGFRVKGLDAPLGVFRLAGLGSARTRFDVSRARGLSRFVGRASELGALKAAFEAARAGQGAVVAVAAPAGTGKSRLCFEFAESCRAAGFDVHEGRALAHGRAIPLVPVLEIFRSYFQIGQADDPRSAREKIAGRLLLLDEGFREVLPVLFDFLGVADPGAPTPRVEPETRQRQLLGVSRRLLQRSSAERPGVMLVEDLHWLDGASEVWVNEWVDAVAGTHGLVLVNYRPEYRADWTQRSHVQQIALAPLGADAIRELVDDLVGSDPSTEGLADAVHARTGGNPFFAEEVVRSLVESGHLEGERGHYRLVSPLTELAVPESVQALLAARIDRLPEREKGVLKAAAVIGKEFRRPILEPVAGLPPDELSESLAHLRSAEFVYEESLYPVAEYSFKHPLTQEVALGSQLAERRRAAHAGVARAIEAFDAERLDEQAAVLAHHWDEAGDALRGARWHARSAAKMMGADVAEARRHWLRVRELIDGLAGDEARELEGTALLELVNLAWRTLLPPEQARADFEQARRHFEERGDLRSLSLLYSNYSLVAAVDADTSVECYRHAVRLARELGDPALELAVSVGVNPPGTHAGRLREALGWLETCFELAATPEPSGPALLHFDPRTFVYSARAAARALLGDLEAAIADSDRALDLTRELAEWDRALAHVERTRIDLLRGDVEAALEHAWQLLRDAEKIGVKIGSVLAFGSVGIALGRAGRWREALPWLQQADEWTDQAHSAWRNPGLATALLECGDPEAALERARTSVELTRRNGYRTNELQLQIELAEVAARTGHESEARAALDRASELAAETEARALVPPIHEAAALLAAARGDEEGRTTELAEALRLYRELGARGHAERLRSELAADSS